MKVLISFIAILFLYSCQELGGDKTLTCPRNSKIDTSITGVWMYIGSKEFNQFELKTNPHTLVILPFNHSEYVLMFWSEKDSSETPTLFKAMESRISAKRIANVQPLYDKPATDFIYYPFKILNDTLYFWGFYNTKVSPDINNKNSIKKFILQHFNDTNYFSSVRKYVRIKTNFSISK
ncbi:MAG: hypothetical protein Fur0028_03890 [Bacteroidales bacterium]